MRAKKTESRGENSSNCSLQSPTPESEREIRGLWPPLPADPPPYTASRATARGGSPPCSAPSPAPLSTSSALWWPPRLCRWFSSLLGPFTGKSERSSWDLPSVVPHPEPTKICTPKINLHHSHISEWKNTKAFSNPTFTTGATPQNKTTTPNKESQPQARSSPLPEASNSSLDPGSPSPPHHVPSSSWSMAMATTSPGPSKPPLFSLHRRVLLVFPLTFRAMAIPRASRPLSLSWTLLCRIASPSSTQSNKTQAFMGCLVFSMVSPWVELLRVTDILNQRLCDVKLPFIVLHGSADVVTDPNVSRELYEEAKSEDKTIKVYEGMMHSLLFGETDENVETVRHDILSWLNARCSGRTIEID